MPSGMWKILGKTMKAWMNQKIKKTQAINSKAFTSIKQKIARKKTWIYPAM